VRPGAKVTIDSLYEVVCDFLGFLKVFLGMIQIVEFQLLKF